MARQLLRESVYNSKRLRACDVETHLAFPFLLPIADHWGRFELDPRAIWVKTCAYRGDIEPERLQRWLDELESNGLWKRYSNGGKEFGAWLNFQGIPKSKRTPSSLPAPPFDNSLSLEQIENPEGTSEGTGDGTGEGTPEGTPTGTHRRIPSRGNTRSRRTKVPLWVKHACKLWTEITAGHVDPEQMEQDLGPLVNRVAESNGVSANKAFDESIAGRLTDYLQTTDHKFVSPKSFAMKPLSGGKRRRA